MSTEETVKGTTNTTYLLHVLLLILGEVQQLVSALKGDVGLGLGLGEINARGEDGNLRAGDMLDGTDSIASEDEALHHVGVEHATAEDLDHAHVIDVELARVLGQDLDAGLGDNLGQHVLIAVLLRGDSALQAAGHLLDVAQILARVAGKA